MLSGAKKMARSKFSSSKQRVLANIPVEERVAVDMYDKYIECNSRMFKHCTLLLLRKNVVKLMDFIKYAEDKDLARAYIIELKYIISKASPEFIKLVRILAIDSNRIKFKEFDGFRTMDFSHNSTRFRLAMNRSRYTAVNDSYWISFADSQPWMMQGIEFNHIKYDATETELYLFADVILSIMEMNRNDAELLQDLNNRNGIEEVLNKYAVLDMDDDTEYVKKRICKPISKTSS